MVKLQKGMANTELIPRISSKMPQHPGKNDTVTSLKCHESSKCYNDLKTTELKTVL